MYYKNFPLALDLREQEKEHAKINDDWWNLINHQLGDWVHLPNTLQSPVMQDWLSTMARVWLIPHVITAELKAKYGVYLMSKIVDNEEVQCYISKDIHTFICMGFFVGHHYNHKEAVELTLQWIRALFLELYAENNYPTCAVESYDTLSKEMGWDLRWPETATFPLPRLH